MGKTGSATEGIYSGQLTSGSATVAAGDVTVTVSGAPNAAKTVEIFPIPATESKALDWMGGSSAIYWFVIKKKTWADLIAVFKKN